VSVSIAKTEPESGCASRCFLAKFSRALVTQGYPPEKLPEYGKDAPLGCSGHPAEIAPAYVFLASDESSFVVKETLNVNGGTPTP